MFQNCVSSLYTYIALKLSHEALTKLRMIFHSLILSKEMYKNKNGRKPAAVIKNRNFSRRGHRQRKESGG